MRSSRIMIKPSRKMNYMPSLTMSSSAERNQSTTATTTMITNDENDYTDLFNTSIKDLEKIFNFKIHLFQNTSSSLLEKSNKPGHNISITNNSYNELDVDLDMKLKQMKKRKLKLKEREMEKELIKRRRIKNISYSSEFIDELEFIDNHYEVETLMKEIIDDHYKKFVSSSP